MDPARMVRRAALVGIEDRQVPLRRIILSVDGQVEPRLASPSDVTDEDDLVIVEAPFLEATGARLDQLAASPLLVVLARRLDPSVLAPVIEAPNLLAILAVDASGRPRVDHLMYVVRRCGRPTAAAPRSHELMRWGATSITWTLRTTEEAGSFVSDLDVIGPRLGLSRADVAATQTAAHELLMNAFYDAPTDRRGRFRFAHRREQPVWLGEAEAPNVRLTVDGTSVAVDVLDPFGQLTRARFFGALARASGPHEVRMDRSHGGAGLGLARSLKGGTLLRADVTPGALTLVSWWRDRTRPSDAQGRSAIFGEASP